MVPGNIYGVVLNDAAEIAALGETLHAKPYGTPPQAPVVYMRPQTCLTAAPVAVASGVELRAAPTIALLFRRDASRLAPEAVPDTIGGAMLALDLMRVSDSYYRPTIAERNGDGYLPLGVPRGFSVPDEIVTTLDGVEAHRWSPSRLVRPVVELVAELSQFMTLQGGDVLLIGLPGDAPVVRAGQRLRVRADGFASLDVDLLEDRA